MTNYERPVTGHTFTKPETAQRVAVVLCFVSSKLIMTLLLAFSLELKYQAANPVCCNNHSRS